MHPENQYRQLISNIISFGRYRPSGWQPLPNQPSPPGTLTLLAQNMVFDLSDGCFPMLTLRKLWFKPILAEILWYLSGSTNVKDLHAMGVHVWDQWATEDTAGSLGYTDGELGPIYGAQWRDFGGRVYYPDGTISHISGFDQIAWVGKLLRDNPLTKRARVIAWHPADMERCFVATCHGDLYFHVFGDQLDMVMVQRSGDVPIGVPFNTAGYALLLMMMAQVLDLKPGKLYHNIIDAHLYENQVPAMQEMIARESFPYPKVAMNPDIKNIFAFGLDDFQLVGYECHPKMQIPVAT